jgi:hypothetical protein
MKIKPSLIVLLVILFGCNKDNMNVTVDGALTDCAKNFTCTYNFYENASIGNDIAIVHGSNRVFMFLAIDSNLCDYTDRLFFKTTTSDNDFDITSSQIAAGGATYIESCPCCNIAFEPHAIGGEIKGKKTDVTHWLLNAKIILGDPSNRPIDTVVVNQYFVVKAIP